MIMRSTRTRLGRGCRFFFLLSCISVVAVVVAARVKLDDALTNDMFPPTSSLCNDGTGSRTTFDFNFNPSSSFFYISQLEEDVFQVEMHHQDDNADRTWTMRIGKGGQIYSFLGEFGEMIPPQAIADAWWVDTVTQTVAVNNVRNTPAEPYFIHQAGTYNRDSTNYTPPAFFSPMLALHCEGPSCSLISWGQQAHIPTSFKSHVLYWTQFRDCGDGLIQYQQAIYNYNQADPSDVLNYFNIPWHGIRQSSLGDLLISGDASSGGALQHEFPLPNFGTAAGDARIQKLRDTAGYAVMAQHVTTPANANFTLCADSTREKDCSEAGATSLLPLVVRGNNTATKNVFWTNQLSELGIDLVVSMDFYDPGTFFGPAAVSGKGNNGNVAGLIFTNSRTGYQVQVRYVIQWVWQKQYAIFSVENGVTLADMNREFIDGDEITVEYAQGGMPLEDNLAMTFVTGKNPEFSDPGNTWWNQPGRIRFGGTPNPKRDLTVFTVNLQADIEPSETYRNRQFFITDRLTDGEARAPPLVDETFQERIEIDDHTGGRSVALFVDDTSFGTAVGTDSCPTADAVACVGWTTPQDLAEPLFYVTCGSEKYVGNDPYHFTPTGTDAVRSYVCDNDTTLRPSWKLLGFFPVGSCDAISGSHSYQDDLCEETNEPTTQPTDQPTTTQPTDQPTTTQPTDQPSTQPTDQPTTTQPTDQPTTQPTDQPTTTPTLGPTTTTHEPTTQPSTSEPTTMQPTAQPTMQPTAQPTTQPTVHPSKTPTAFFFPTQPTTTRVDVTSSASCSDVLASFHIFRWLVCLVQSVKNNFF